MFESHLATLHDELIKLLVQKPDGLLPHARNCRCDSIEALRVE